jgi:hypothetical protein
VCRRHLSPDVYFAWLQQTIIEHSQLRLLELLKERIEALPASQPIAWADRCCVP